MIFCYYFMRKAHWYDEKYCHEEVIEKQNLLNKNNSLDFIIDHNR